MCPTLDEMKVYHAAHNMVATSPTEASIVQMVKESTKLQLSFRRQKKLPLLESHISQIYQACAAAEDATLASIALVFRLSLMHEACLRWDDPHSLTFGDMLFTKRHHLQSDATPAQ